MEMTAEYLVAFHEESSELLVDWERCALALERNPADRESLNDLFRAIHTLKGSAGFIEFEELQRLAHDLESLLSRIRDGNRRYDGHAGDLMLAGLDLARGMIEGLRAGSRSLDPEASASLARLVDAVSDLAKGPGSVEPTAARNEGVSPKQGSPSLLARMSQMRSSPDPVAAGKGGSRYLVSIEGTGREAYLRSCLVMKRLERQGTVLSTDPAPESLRDSGNPFRFHVTLQATGDPAEVAASIEIDQVTFSVDPPSIAATPPAIPAEGARSGEPGSSSRPEQVVRVSVQKLDSLMNLVGELVVQNSGFVATASKLKESYGKVRFVLDLEEKTAALVVLTRELQEGVMKARMLAIASVFDRFRRVVRDLAKYSGKLVNLEVAGERTEIDKKVIDRIGEPLVHLIRNAVDHGIEQAAARLAAGKPEAGTIRLGAFQEGDHICIEVGDDGKGLDRRGILKRAVATGLLNPEEAAAAGEERILGLIFQPGFSTAETVTDISGRGVGMDAVKRTVDELGGQLRVKSAQGKGTTVTISLPLTMAIVRAVLVEASGSIYAIPITAVREIVKTRSEEIQTVGTAQVILLRSEVLALLSLSGALGGGRRNGPAARRPIQSIVVVSFDGRRLGIEVDRVLGSREVVIKSLGKHYREVEGLAGASILGDGAIALIVDVRALFAASAGTSGAAVPVRRTVAKEPRPAVRNVTPKLMDVAVNPQAVRRESVEELASELQGSAGRFLEEMNNQGAIQASMALSQLTGGDIHVSFPEARLVALGEIAGLLGGAEAPIAGIFVGMQGELAGGVLLVIPEANVLALHDVLHGQPQGTTRTLGEVDLSSIGELGNILGACFMNAIADMAHLKLAPEVPEVVVDMCLPAIDSVLARFNQPGDKLLFTEAQIYDGRESSVVCHQLLFLEPASLRKLLGAMSGPADSAGAA